MKSLMIQGTGSDAGKSLLVTGLCRIFKRKGVKVAPFKAQNMALNSWVTPDGLEIGRAQALQAEAAGVEISVEMNPVLIKPHGNSRSQIVVMGKPWQELEAVDYYKKKELLWEKVTASLDSLRSRFDLIIAEGAGSPAEINLAANDIVNMAVARYLKAPVLLAADINLGGVFASLYGTVELVGEENRELIKGFIINKFRGDKNLLLPGLDMLKDITGGRKTLGVVPWIPDLHLAQEDSVFLEKNRFFGSGDTDIAVISYPHMSNYDDFDALLLEEGVQVRMVKSPSELGSPSAVILPGSKTTIKDLLWMKETGLFKAVCDLAGKKTPVLGICGGYQMLGRSIRDPESREGTVKECSGFSLLPFDTLLTGEKRTVRTVVKRAASSPFKEFFDRAEGYEVHMGRSLNNQELSPLFITEEGQSEGGVTRDGLIAGTYLHGVFNSPGFRRAWLQKLSWTPKGPGKSLREEQERELDRLADIMEENIDIQAIERILG